MIDFFAAEPSSSLPTYVAIAASIAATLATLSTAIVAIFLIKANRRKTNAEAAKQESEVPFAGGQFVKELSDAAASLVTPLRNENAKLQERVALLEERVNRYEDNDQRLNETLLREREAHQQMKDGFDRRLREVTVGYQLQISELEREKQMLEARVESLAQAPEAGVDDFPPT